MQSRPLPALGSVVGDGRAAERYAVGCAHIAVGSGQIHRRGGSGGKAVGNDGPRRVARAGAVLLVDKGHIEIGGVADRIGCQVQFLRVANGDGLDAALAAQFESLEGRCLGIDLVVAGGVGMEGVRVQPSRPAGLLPGLMIPGFFGLQYTHPVLYAVSML